MAVEELRRALGLAAEAFIERTQGLDQRASGGVEIDEDEAVPGLDLDLEQREVLGIEAGGRAEPGRLLQPAIEGIGPIVVAADELAIAASLALGDQGPGAMAADIVEALQPPCSSRMTTIG